MIDELVKTVRLHLSERLTSPLMGAFVVSWCLWNYRTILVLLSEEPVLEKFRILHEVVYPDWQHNLGSGLVFPLATCLVYLFLYPYPAKLVYAYSRKKQREILEIRRKSENETPLTIEDSRKIKDQLAKAEIAHYEEIDRKEAEVSRLKSQISSLQNELAEAHKLNVGIPSVDISSKAERGDQLKYGYEPNTPKLSGLLLDTLKIVAGYRSVTVGSLMHELHDQTDELALEYSLDELAKLGLLSTWDERGVSHYSLSHDGRATVIREREAEAIRAATRPSAVERN